MAWSEFFGKIRGRSATEATRCGTKDSGLSMVCASKTGDITVRMSHWGGRHCFEIKLTDWGSATFDEITLARGSFVGGEAPPVLMLDDAVVRAHVEREALKALTKED